LLDHNSVCSLNHSTSGPVQAVGPVGLWPYHF